MSDLVGNPEDRFSRVAAHLVFLFPSTLFSVWSHVYCRGDVLKPSRYLSLCNLGLRPGPTQTGRYMHRRWLEAGNFGFK